MKKKIIFIFVFAMMFVVVFASKPYKIVFYNVENLFDTINSPGVSDKEFTPKGEKRWTSDKYFKKIGNLERVFSDIAAFDKKLPCCDRCIGD